MIVRRAALLCSVFVLMLIGAGCSGDDTTASDSNTAANSPKVTGEVVVLSSRDEKFMRPLWELVRERHPKLDLVVDYGKDAGYLDRIRSEGDSPQADLFLSKGSVAVSAAAADGLLQPLPAELTDRVPTRFRGEGGTWVGLSARARIIVARRILANKPLSVGDLAESRFRGRVARTVATNSSFVGGVAALLSDRSEGVTRAFLLGLDANSRDGNVHPKHTPAVAAVATGRADLALVNHCYFYRQVLGAEFDPEMSQQDAERLVAEAPIEAIYPDSDTTGVAWNVTGGGVIKGAPHSEAALAILDVLLSDEGQQAFAWSNREYPVVEGVPSPPGVRPADSFGWSDTTLPELAANHATAVELIAELGLE